MDSLVLLRAVPESMANLAPGAQRPAQVGQGLSVCVCVCACVRARVYVCVGGDGVGRLGTEGYPAQAELRNGA